MIHIDLSPDLEARLASEARSLGMRLEDYIQALLAAQIPDTGTGREARRHAVEAMLAFGERHGVTLGGEDLRAVIHEGHKY